MIEPRSFQKVTSSEGNIIIPLYVITDITENYCRIKLGDGSIGCYRLEDPDDSHPLRISTHKGIKGVDLTIDTPPPTDPDPDDPDNPEPPTDDQVKNVRYGEVNYGTTTHGRRTKY
ncbi:hypothetical protein [Halobacillus litoralis]|uniref:hypothetical protein n=1 Tax=Halobacillus litoralis TaxID=45668 RepID=UPI001CD1CEB4|nr:hypothetical protein [Halobacillus litoralis]MCA1021664.1 hypothetical protein [Halobacillus litoralis]